MNLLLDTHAFLWFITGDDQLTLKALNKITDSNNKCFVSIASIWEIVIKMSINKLEIKGGFETIEDFLENNDMEILTLNFSHTKSLLNLPYYHNDPFDRIIISQSVIEKMTIITKDKAFKNYNISIIW